MLTNKNDIAIAKSQLQNSFNFMIKNLENIEYFYMKRDFSSAYRKDIYKIRKKFVDYLIKDIDFIDALDFLAVDFWISQDVIDRVLRPQYEIFKRRELSKKIYTARLMCKANFTTKQIAGVLKCTPATVRNYLKTTSKTD